MARLDPPQPVGGDPGGAPESDGREPGGETGLLDPAAQPLSLRGRTSAARADPPVAKDPGGGEEDVGVKPEPERQGEKLMRRHRPVARLPA